MKKSGFFDINTKNETASPKVKFTKTKLKGIKKPKKAFKGYFITGALPTDKIRNGKIVKNGYSKTFIPLDIPPSLPDDEIGQRLIVIEILKEALKPYPAALKENTYFTITILGGYEIGQNLRRKTPKDRRRAGQSFTRGASGQRKLEFLADDIAKLCVKGEVQYGIENDALVEGVNLWEFNRKKQRKPKNPEKRAIKRRSGQ